jgi:hypothetical protein
MKTQPEIMTEGLKATGRQLQRTLLQRQEVRITRVKEFLIFPSGFFFRMIVPLHLIEFDGLL